jgi:hypothetical protein
MLAPDMSVLFRFCYSLVHWIVADKNFKPFCYTD